MARRRALAVVRLAGVIAEPDREMSPLVSVAMVVLFAAAAGIWFVQYRRNRGGSG